MSEYPEATILRTDRLDGRTLWRISGSSFSWEFLRHWDGSKEALPCDCKIAWIRSSQRNGVFRMWSSE